MWGVLSYADGVARATFSSPIRAKDTNEVETKAIIFALDV